MGVSLPLNFRSGTARRRILDARAAGGDVVAVGMGVKRKDCPSPCPRRAAPLPLQSVGVVGTMPACALSTTGKFSLDVTIGNGDVAMTLPLL